MLNYYGHAKQARSKQENDTYLRSMVKYVFNRYDQLS